MVQVRDGGSNVKKVSEKRYGGKRKEDGRGSKGEKERKRLRGNDRQREGKEKQE